MGSYPEEPGEDDAAAGECWGFTRGHRLGLGLLLAGLLGLLIYHYVRRPMRLDDGVVVVRGPDGHAVVATLPRLVDPNQATAEELARIPGVGVKTAEALVKYRAARREMAEDGRVFLRLADVERVPGVGKKTAENMGEYLAFPQVSTPETPATEEASPGSR